MQNQDRHQGRAAAATALFVAVGISLVVGLSLKVDDRSEPVALVFPNHVDGASALAMTISRGGDVIQFGRTENIVIARFDGGIHRIASTFPIAPIILNANGLSGCNSQSRIRPIQGPLT